MKQPLITIVTPSFNQAAYLPETIDSILSQKYAHLRYIIIDGGSTDGSVEIIRRHAEHLTYWVSEKDRGQADALNKGFTVALQDTSSSHMCAYLNSDDVYPAGTLERVADEWQRARRHARNHSPDTTWIVGDVMNFGVNVQDHLTRYPAEHFQCDRWDWLYSNPVHQPGAFWAAELHRRYGPFDESFRYVFDYDLFIKFRILGGVRPIHVPRVLARFRHHDASKTVTERSRFEPEFEQVQARIAATLSPGELQQMQYYVSRFRRGDHLQARAVQHLREGHRVPAFRDLVQSLWLSPRLIAQRRTLGALKRFLVKPV